MDLCNNLSSATKFEGRQRSGTPTPLVVKTVAQAFKLIRAQGQVVIISSAQWCIVCMLHTCSQRGTKTSTVWFWLCSPLVEHGKDSPVTPKYKEAENSEMMNN